MPVTQTPKPAVDFTKPFWLVYNYGGNDYGCGCNGAFAVQTREEAVISAQNAVRQGASRSFIAEVSTAFELPVKQVSLVDEVPF